MMLTRSAHIEQKGLDLAALAVAGVRTRPGELAPELLIRGAPFDGCDALRAELQRCSGLSGDRIDVRPFTTDSDEINRDLFRAALYLLPSRVEGFGLAALEAIARGTPVLVSSKSGLAEALREHLGLDAGPIIVDVHGDARDVPTWRDAIARAMWDLPGRFEHADKIRHSLSRTMRWDDTVATLLAAVEQPAGDGCGDVAPPSIKGAR
jgi:glycosyltransferase involved in cell wall biosynthesis